MMRHYLLRSYLDWPLITPGGGKHNIGPFYTFLLKNSSVAVDLFMRVFIFIELERNRCIEACVMEFLLYFFLVGVKVMSLVTR